MGEERLGSVSPVIIGFLISYVLADQGRTITDYITHVFLWKVEVSLPVVSKSSQGPKFICDQPEDEIHTQTICCRERYIHVDLFAHGLSLFYFHCTATMIKMSVSHKIFSPIKGKIPDF